jgi:hypothetical protein
MMYAYDFIPFFAPAEGNPYLNDLATFTRMGAYSLSSAESGVALTQPAAVFEGEGQPFNRFGG